MHVARKTHILRIRLLATASVLAVFACLLSTRPAGAAEYLPVEPLADKKVRLDGTLLEWPAGGSRLSQTVSGTPLSVEAQVGYDASHLYIAATIKDARIVRTLAASAGEDHLELDVYFPGPGAGIVHRIAVFPGDPGKLAGLVKVDGKTVSNARAVEAPSEGSYTLEAQLPWSALPEAQTLRVGLQGKLTYTDASAVGQIRGVVTTSRAEGARLPPLPLASETGLIQTLLEPKNLGLQPARSAYGDVAGQAKLERVALYGHFLSIAGPDYRDGKQFYFNELDVERADQVTRLELRDVTGDKKSEIILGKRLGSSESYREVLQILQIGADGAPRQIFIHETALVTPTGRIENKVKIAGEGASASVEIAQGKASGFEAATFREPTLGAGIQSVLLPWQEVSARIYGFKGDGLALLEEKRGPAQPSGRSRAASQPSSAPAAAHSLPPPRPPTADEMLDRVYALYRKDRGVGDKSPRFDFVTDVVEDERNERVLVHDKDIVVFGKGFKSGTSYTSITIGVKESRDILGVTASDLTGDEKAEIIVHARLEAKASPGLGADVVERQMLFIYGVVGENLVRVFAAETGRSLKDKRIVGGLRFLPAPRGSAIEITSLRAIGWTEKTYPFPPDTVANAGIEPLLLPWGSESSRVVRFDGKIFAGP